MGNQPTDDRTAEELKAEREELKAITKALKDDIKLGEDFAVLSQMPEFNRVFKKLYYDDGRKFLWENINHIEEEIMKKARDEAELERGKKNLVGLRRQVDARLVFKSFCDTIEFDYENAKANLEELAEQAKAEAEQAEGK